MELSKSNKGWAYLHFNGIWYKKKLNICTRVILDETVESIISTRFNEN